MEIVNPATGVARGDQGIIIAAYAKNAQTGEVIYVQDEDDLCYKDGLIADETLFHSVSYNSIHGMIFALPHEEE